MAAIKIDGKAYEIPSSLRVGETRVIKKVTGMNPPEFMKALESLHETQDPDVGAAMVWWIVHREDPSFTIDQVDELEWGAIEGEGEADPKAARQTSSEHEITSSSPSSVSESSPTPEDRGGMTPASGGVPGLALSGLGT